MTKSAAAVAFVAAFAILSACAGPSGHMAMAGEAHPEASPYSESADAMADVDAALARASTSGKRVILVMGANWCHDSRGLAGLFETPRFAAMLGPLYEIVYVDAGQPRADQATNMDVARRFGIENLIGTPNVFILSSSGERLNGEDDVLGWRDAASRDPDDVYDYFAGFAPDSD
ncbi:MAG: thioredoxin family protein [Pacificimonas sp.]